MHFRHLALTAALACALNPAFAADQAIDLSSGKASFAGTTPLLDGGDDVVTFTNLAAGSYEFVLTLSGQFISGFGAEFNGQTVPNLASFPVFSGFLISTGSSPFALTLTGTALPRANYSGELSVTAVPEPATGALLLAGLAAIGWCARRQRAG